jgi:hypothetical protein
LETASHVEVAVLDEDLNGMATGGRRDRHGQRIKTKKDCNNKAIIDFILKKT